MTIIYAYLLKQKKCLHKKRIQLPEDFFGTPTWPPFLERQNMAAETSCENALLLLGQWGGDNDTHAHWYLNLTIISRGKVQGLKIQQFLNTYYLMAATVRFRFKKLVPFKSVIWLAGVLKWQFINTDSEYTMCQRWSGNLSNPIPAGMRPWRN